MRTQRPPSSSKLTRPREIVLEDGRKVLEGSLSMTSGAILSDAQKKEIIRALKKPTVPSALVSTITGLNAQNPFHLEAIRRFIAQLENDGEVAQVKNDKGRLVGWQATDVEEGEE